jgi:MFS family permease
MTVGVAPAAIDHVAAQVASRLVVGAGEGLMMSAAVLWLLRLSGPARRGRALGHIGLANYGGLACGPLLADAVDGYGSVLAIAAVLPLAGAAVVPPAAPPAAAQERDGAGLFGATLRPGVGLMLVNVGYAAVLAFGGGRSPLVVPAFAVTVIAVRTAGAGIPDRFGARATLAAAAPLAAAGLVVVAVVPGAALLGVVTLGAGQALAVPALGLLALARIPPARHGVAAGLFFSWFDAGVGLGGPAAGILAQIGGPTGALIGAAIAVACTAPLTLISTIRPPWEPLVN